VRSGAAGAVLLLEYLRAIFTASLASRRSAQENVDHAGLEQAATSSAAKAGRCRLK
jgi:hypothetical protein